MKWYQKSTWIIVLLVLFSPVGLYLMWKYANWNRAIKWVTSAVFGIYILFYLMIIVVTIIDPTVLDTEDVKVETKEEIKIEPEKEATTSAEEKAAKEAVAKKKAENQKPKALTLEDKIKNKANDVLGDKANWGDKERVREVVVYDVENLKEVAITFNANENITSGLTRTGIQGGFVKLFPAIFPIDPLISRVDLFAYLSVTDVYGNDKEIITIRAAVTKATNDKINWEVISYDDLSKILDEYVEVIKF